MAKERVKRKLSAILCADVVGYSRLMGEDEAATLHALNTCEAEIIEPTVKEHNGRIFKRMGDGFLVEFSSTVDSVDCAVAWQKQIEDKKCPLKFRIGINLGDVIAKGDDMYGDGINIAARVEKLADPGGICISRNIFDQIKNKVDLGFEHLGEQQFKNISDLITVYKLLVDPKDISKVLGEKSPKTDKDFLPLPDKPSIAVLPFTNMSGDLEHEYFSDGITEDIITALSRSPWLFVISRNSSFAYRGTNVDVKKISKELGVRYILEGSVRKAGNRVRVTAQLIEGATGGHVWAERYDGELHDIFDLQDKITHQIVATLLTQIQIYVGVENKQTQRPDIVTWDLLARGLKSFYSLSQEGISSAEKIYRMTITSNPESCDAYWMLAASLFHQVWMGYLSENATLISEAYKLSKKAILLDDNNEYAHWTLGLIQFIRSKHDEAIAQLKRALELNPNCSLSYGSLGTVLSFSGEPEESIKNNEIAIRLNPRDPSIFFRYSGIAMAHYVAGRYLEATHWSNKSIHRKPIWRIGHAVLAASLVQLGQLKEAKGAVANYLENIPDETITKLRKVLLFKCTDDLNRIEKGLCMAGLPEK